MKISEKSAIVVIEFQKQWTEKGLYRFLINRQIAKNKTIEKTLDLVTKMRENGVPIIHAPLIINPQNKEGILANLTFGKVFTKDTWKSEFVDGIYQDGDLVIKGRYGFDAFLGSNLEEMLKENEIENVFLCGFITDQCVEKTLKTALAKGFNALMISDCTATFSEFLQKRTESKYKNRTYTYNELLKSCNW